MAKQIPDCPDYCTRKGAEKLATMINYYWAKRGFHAGARVEPAYDRIKVITVEDRTFAVRSNLVNGWPCERIDGVA